MATELKWGSPEWKTHMRRSLAQKKRHGANITDIESLIIYIERKGPAKDNRSNKKSVNKKPAKPAKRSTNKIVNAGGRKIVTAPSPLTVTPNESGFFGAPTILKGR